ncbi:hypothetical protein BJX65DRAFT_310677 [Aspergillus insuetus]
MVVFSALPAEIWSMILGDCDFKAYRTLSLISKDFRSIATPYLYREIHWGCLPAHLENWSCKNLQCLVQTLIENPGLAVHVRSLNLHIDYEYSFEYEEYYLESYPMSQADPDIYAASMVLLQSLSFGDDSTWWSDALDAGNPDAWIALLLSQLGRLQSLTLNAALLHHSTYIAKAFNHLARTGHFKYVQRISFGENLQGYEMAGLCIPNELVTPLFGLPSLQELDLTLTDPMIKTWDLDVNSPSTTLRTLRLYRSHITGNDLDGLISLTPGLRELHCGFLRDEREIDMAEKIDYHMLHQALRRVSEMLEILTVDVCWNDKNCAVFGVDFGILGPLPMPSLSEFHALKRLEIPLELLVGKRPWATRTLADALPSNLQFLTLKDERVTWRMPWGTMYEQTRSRDNDMQDIIDQISGYLTCSQRQAFLESLTLDLSNGPPFPGDLIDPATGRCYSVQVEQLRTLAETARVRLSVVFTRKVGSGHVSATLVVYDPLTSGQPPAEYGLYAESKAGKTTISF